MHPSRLNPPFLYQFEDIILGLPQVCCLSKMIKVVNTKFVVKIQIVQRLDRHAHLHFYNQLNSSVDSFEIVDGQKV